MLCSTLGTLSPRRMTAEPMLSVCVIPDAANISHVDRRRMNCQIGVSVWGPFFRLVTSASRSFRR